MTPNEQPRQCPSCGDGIRLRSAPGHCPRCLISLGFSEGFGSERSRKVRSFGDYELLEQIGVGGMGIVYRARQTSLNRTVALKMVLDSHTSSPLVLRRFEIEAEAAARLEHPHIVSIFEIGSEEEQPFISMRFVEGESLARKIARGEFGPSSEGGSKVEQRKTQERGAQLVATMARAVHFAHQRGVIHRDIKPGNILIDALGQPHLTDFGLAKLTDSKDRLSQTGTLTGTLSYMAPEQMAGAEATMATDIYSLGSVLYELLTGQVPFSAATPIETLQMVAGRPPQRPSAIRNGIDRDFETICLKCLEKQPSHRYSSAEALAGDLERWQRGETILARPVGAALITSLFVGMVVSLAFLQVVFAEKQAVEKKRFKFENTRHAIFRAIGLNRFWSDPNATISVPSEFLAQSIDSDPGPPQIGSVRYRIGLLLEEDPAEVIIGYAPLTRKLEQTVSGLLGYPVLFDLTLYHDQQEAAINGLRDHEVDILKIGGASFLEANAQDPGIRPMVGQNPPKNGIIFARKNSGMKTVADLVNSSVAIKSQNSTVSVWGVFTLHKAGVPISNVKILGRAVISQENGGAAAVIRSFGSGPVMRESPIIDAVLNSSYDAGIETESVYIKHRGSGDELVVLERFPSSRIYWLASSNLPEEVAHAFTEAMATLDPALLQRLPDRVITYSAVTDDEVSELREAQPLMRGVGAGGK